MPRKCWDRYAIKAEIHRRGKTLTGLAIENDVEPSACRVALLRRYPKGEAIISKFIGVPKHVLWPKRYAAVTSKAKSSGRRGARKGQKIRTRTDRRNAA